MVSKVLFFALVGLLVVQATLADYRYCPNPEAAKNLVYTGEVHEEAPLYGRISKKVSFTTDGKYPSCIILNGFSFSESSGGVSISAIGFSEDGEVIVDLVSTIKNGIDVSIEVYTA